MSRGRHRRPNARRRQQKPRLHGRRIVTLALPVAVAASVPVGVAAWPDGSANEPAEAVADKGADGRLDRSSALSRGSVNRVAPHPSTSPSVSLTTPEPEPTETPEPEPEPTETAEPEPEPTETAEPTAVGQMYVTTALNVRSGAGSHASVLTVLARGTKVDITGETDGDWVQILHDGEVAWVNGDYLSESEPAEEVEETAQASTTSGGLSMEPCDTGSSVESGLTQNAIKVHRAVCAEFPQVSTYLGVRSGGGAHGEGRALDIMVGSNSGLGDAIAAFVRENYQALGVSEVIWAQRIWTVQRASEGWRWMEDRGSATANHYDHVHVTVNG